MKFNFRKISNLIIKTLSVLLSSFETKITNSKKYKTPTEQAKEMQTKIIQCFINKDKETLKSLFSEYVREDYDLNNQIDTAFNFIDGKIVKYDSPTSMACGSFDIKGYNGNTDNIITEKGTKYSIGFKGWLTNDKEHKKIGVLFVEITNETMYVNFPKYNNPYDIFIGDENG